MKIAIDMTEQNFGTEFGELTPLEYHYRCFEIDDGVFNSNLIIVEMQEINEALKSAFLAKLNSYLNQNYKYDIPDDYLLIANQIRKDTICNSFNSKNVIMGLFKPNDLPKDVAKLIDKKTGSEELVNASVVVKRPVPSSP